MCFAQIHIISEILHSSVFFYPLLSRGLSHGLCVQAGKLEVSFFIAVVKCSLPARKYITDVLLERGSAYFSSQVFMSTHVRIYVIHPVYIAKALNYTIHVYGIQSFNTVFSIFKLYIIKYIVPFSSSLQQQLRNSFTSHVKSVKSKYYLSVTTENLNNPRKFWKAIKLISTGDIRNELPPCLALYRTGPPC